VDELIEKIGLTNSYISLHANALFKGEKHDGF